MRSEPVFDIQQATKNDISIIEDIFFDVIRWMDEKDISNKWNSDNIKLYEKNGFVLVGQHDCGNNYIMALYSYDLL